MEFAVCFALIGPIRFFGNDELCVGDAGIPFDRCSVGDGLEWRVCFVVGRYFDFNCFAFANFGVGGSIDLGAIVIPTVAFDQEFNVALSIADFHPFV